MSNGFQSRLVTLHARHRRLQQPFRSIHSVSRTELLQLPGETADKQRLPTTTLGGERKASVFPKSLSYERIILYQHLLINKKEAQ